MVRFEMGEADAERVLAALARMRAIQGGEVEPGSPFESEDIALGLAEQLGSLVESAAARENAGWSPVEVAGTDAIVYNPGNAETPYAAVSGYDPATNGWASGQYRETLLGAYSAAHDAWLVDVAAPDVVAWSVFTDEDVEQALEGQGFDLDEAPGVPDRVRGEWGEKISDIMTERGHIMLDYAVAEAVRAEIGEQAEEAEAEEAQRRGGGGEEGRWFFRSDDYVGLSDEEASELVGLQEVEPADSLWEELRDRADSDMVEEAYSIDRALGYPDVAVRGASRRWDGTSEGFAGPFPSVRALLGDTGRGGVFQDCGIDAVWDEGGALMARGVHHDGSVTVEVRPVTEALAEALASGDAGAMRAAWDEAPAARAWERLGYGGSGGGCDGAPAWAAALDDGADEDLEGGCSL